MINNIVSPYCSDELVNLISKDDYYDIVENIKNLPKIEISHRAKNDILMLADGSFTPLNGFMTHDNWKNVCKEKYTIDNVFWPIPIILDVSQEDADKALHSSLVVLTYKSSSLAILEVTDVWKMTTESKEFECDNVYRGKGPESIDWSVNKYSHPGCQNILNQKEYNIGGKITLIDKSCYINLEGFSYFENIYRSPQELRKMFYELGWKNIVAFQTRNPIHRAHEHLIKMCMSIFDGVLIHINLGKLKEGDIPVEVRIDCIKTLLNNYFKIDKNFLAGYPLDMRYAGPREALLHAIFRQNCGINNIIIGRDHAGVKNFYDIYESQQVFDIAPDYLLCKPLKMEHTFYCKKCDGMSSSDICPHNKEDRIIISGTKLRKLLSDNEEIPSHFSRPEVIEILRNYYCSLK